VAALIGERIVALGALFAIVLVGACSTSRSDTASSAVPESSAFLAQMRPSDLQREFEAVQLVTVSRSDKSFIAEVRLSVRPDRLTLVAQDMLGERLMTIVWTDRGVTEERSPKLPPGLSPAGMLADLVATGANEDAVRRALEGTGSQLIVHPGQRIIVGPSGESMRATLGWRPGEPWTGRLAYRNLRAGYSVDVQSVEQQ
jgi:hypothetical protein